MAKVKICGITKKEDAIKAARIGAEAVGFIFYKKSKRNISPSKAKKIIEALPPFVTPVGVFVNEKMGKIRDIISHCGLGAVQLHGDEDHHFAHRLKRYNVSIIKAFRVGDDFDPAVVAPYKVDALLFDTYQEGEYGGTGKSFEKKKLRNLSTNIPIIISGGLDHQNVIEVVNDLNPYAVDASSSIEKSPGIKDHRKMKDFIEVVQFISGPKVK